MTPDVPHFDGIVLARFCMDEDQLIIAASLTLRDGFTWSVHIRGQRIPTEAHDSVPSSIASPSAVEGLLGYIDDCDICCGHPDPKFLPLLEARKGKFMDSSGM